MKTELTAIHADETTRVLIGGGSLVGLSTALLQPWHGVPCPLITDEVAPIS